MMVSRSSNFASRAAFSTAFRCLGRYVNTGQIRAVFKQLPALAVRFRFLIMIFDGTEQFEIRIEGSQGAFNAGILLRVLGDRHIGHGIAIEPSRPPTNVPIRTAAMNRRRGYRWPRCLPTAIGSDGGDDTTGIRAAMPAESRSATGGGGEGNNSIHIIPIAASNNSSSPSRGGDTPHTDFDFPRKMESAASRIPVRTSSQNEVVPRRVLTEIRNALGRQRPGRKIGPLSQGPSHLQDSVFG